MASRFTKGQIVILAMFGAVALYVATLLLLVEPTIWRNVPPEGMSRHGLAPSPDIAELRLYRLPHRGFAFYFDDELAHYQPLARITDPAAIASALEILAGAGHGTAPACRRAESDTWLHAVALGADGATHGYAILIPGREAGCALLLEDGPGPGVTTSDIHGAIEGLQDLTGVRF